LCPSPQRLDKDSNVTTTLPVTPAPAPADSRHFRRTGDSGPEVSRALRWTAKAAALTLLPSGLWRIAIAFGWDSGFAAGDPLHHSEFPGAGSFYLIALSVFAELVGLSALGLVQRWGEVVPRWIPRLGGRRIPTMAAVLPASLGALAVTAITVWGALAWNDPGNMGAPESPRGHKYWIMTACYAPLVLWGPLLAIVTVAYYQRRRRQASHSA
jgi:hypothetical protein